MCGIVGVISWSETHRVTRADLQRMTDAIAHRGPDGEGFYFNIDPDDLSQTISRANPQVAFGFRRLAVLDPEPRSMQPFQSTDGRYVMVFNGEIYNFRELREELTQLDPTYAWRTQGDTEVLLRCYQHWGEDCLHKLNGMFALAIWDGEKKSLFLARDRMGQKPLYYISINSPDASNLPACIKFGSELTSLMEPIPLDRHSLVEYLRFGHCPVGLQTHDVTMLQTCGPHPTLSMQVSMQCHDFALPPGTTYGPRSLRGEVLPTRSNPYFDGAMGSPTEEELVRATGKPPDWSVTLTPDYKIIAGRHNTSDFRRAIEIAVERQLVSDVPLGIFLSGGIDSSVIALCASRRGPVKTFSIAFDDPRYDESPYAREVAKHLGTDHHEFRVTPNVIEDLPKLARVFGEPFADSSAIPTHYLCRETRKHVTVALSGDGGDELFGGYDRYIAMREAERFPRLLGTLVSPLGRRFANGHPKSKLTRIARFVLTLSLSAAERYDALMRVFDGETIVALTGSAPANRSGVRVRFEEQHKRTGNVVTAALATDRVTYLPNDLLTKVDRCSMLHSLEVRSPFMDHELVELAAQLTEDQLLKGGKKRMLREAFASELPASVFNRPKMGFAVPIGEWFRGPLRAFLRDHLFASDSFAKAHFQLGVVERLVDEHESQRRDHSQRLYALLMLEMWWKYVVRIRDEG